MRRLLRDTGEAALSGELAIGSLFSGIGGLELGLERAGLGPVAWQVEHVPPIREGSETATQTLRRSRRQTAFHHAVLAKHWPAAQRFERVQDVGALNLSPIGVLCGGFPCQDVSTANPQAQGIAGARSGLWWEFHRIAADLRPRWLVIENVFHAWGRWVPAVRESLWGLGYASVCLRVSAADVGARHRRARGFVVADRDGLLLRVQPGLGGWEGRIREAVTRAALTHAGRLGAGEAGGSERESGGEPVGGADGQDGDAAPNADSPRHEERRGLGGDPREEQSAALGAIEPWPGAGTAEPALGLSVHGLSLGLAGRAAAYRRKDRIKALGNAVVPACAEAVGYVIQAIEAGRWGQLSLFGGVNP